MSINTLNTSDKLEKGGFDQTQARSLTSILAEFHNTTASKEDIKTLEKQVTNQIQTLSTTSKEDIKALENQVTNQIQTVKTELTSDIKGLSKDFSSLEQKILAQFSILDNNIKSFDKRLEDIKWFVVFAIGFAIGLAGLILALSRIFS